MGVSRHPSGGLRQAYAIGDIAPGAALAVATHLEFCERCAASLAGPGERFTSPGAEARRDVAEQPLAPRLPRTLQELPLRRWRWVGFGLRAAGLVGAAGLGEAIFLLKVRPGAQLTLGAAADYLVLLAGRLPYPEGDIEPGDLVELARNPVRRVRAAAPEGALALVVGDDTLFRRPIAGLFGEDR